MKPLKNRSFQFCDRSQTYSLWGIAMLMIIFQHIYVQMGAEPKLFLPMAGLGYVGTGFFFFLSGFGLFVSLKSKTNIGKIWLWSKSKKLLIPFFFAYVLYFLVSLIFRPEVITRVFIFDFFSLSIPYTSTCFLKVIVGVYFCFFLIFSKKNLETRKVLLMSILCGLYFVVAFLYLPDYWYTSILNFPLGLFAGLFYDKIKRPSVIVICVGLFLGGAAYKYMPMDYAFVPSLLLTVCFMFVIMYVRIHCFVLDYIGKNSMGFYLFQWVWFPIGHLFTANWWVYAVFVLGMTGVSSVLFSNILKLNRL